MNDFVREKPIGGNGRAPVGFSDSANRLCGDENRERAAPEKFVVFFLGERLYGVSAGDVAEVSQPVQIAALPGAPEWLLGIGNLRAEIIAIINLPPIIGENSPSLPAKTKLIVLRTKNYDMTIAFPVDKLSEIITADDIRHKGAAGNESPFVYAELTHQSNVVRLIDFDKLLTSLTLIKTSLR